MKIGSLFSGVGGLEKGLEWAGVGETIWQVEQDPYCLAVLAKHYPTAQRFTDVRDVGAHNLPPVDVICGGFPCQDISVAGAGAGLAGARSGLWYEYLRIVRELRPRYVVVENVAALTNRGLDRVLGSLADCGYDAEWSCIQALDVGAPHKRDRLFIIAYASGEQSGQQELRAERGLSSVAAGNGAQEPLADAARVDVARRGHLGADPRDTECDAEIPERRADDVADADGAGLEGRHGDVLRECAGQQRARSRRPHLADADGRGESQSCGPKREVRRRIADGSQWEPESGVGVSSDGISAEAYGDRLNADATKDRSGEEMQIVRNEAESEAIRRQAGGSHRISPPQVLRSGVHGSRLCQRCALRLGAIETSDEVSRDILRSVWIIEAPRGASHRSEPEERLAREYPDVVRELSHYASSPCATCWADGSWEDGIPRVATGVKKRTHRLKALGNAVVPACAEVVGRRLMEIDATLRGVEHLPDAVRAS